MEIQAGLGKTQYGCIPMAPHTAWEWLEQYGPVSLPKAIKEKSHKEREEALTAILENAKCSECMEKKLKETASMAKSRAELLTAGSGYGALAEQRQWSKHLEFTLSSNSLEKWKHFFETGVLHKPDARDIPDEFLIDGENLEFLVNTLKSSNKDNWYAYYQAGIGYFSKEDYETAKKLLIKSYNMEENPWSCHGIACICLIMGQKEEAVKWISQGLRMECRNLSYLKESLKILYLCEANKEIVDFFEKQDREVQEVGKLKFYYISALHRMGEDKKAYEILEKDGGLVIDDIREGEDSIAQLWSDLYEKLYGVKAEVPYRYDFKAF